MKKSLTKNRGNFIGILFIILIIVVGIVFFYSTKSGSIGQDPNVNISSEELSTLDNFGINEYILVDVLTGENFYIEADVPIILETFAVWCPTCLRQQKEIKKLHEELGNKILSISLDVDPNENQDLVINHANSNDLDWYFAISPQNLTKELIEEFGNRIVSAPSAPIVIICPNLEYKFLERGVKSVEKLRKEILFCNG